MSLPGVILVGTDLSETADEAVRQAHRYATARTARLAVCHVIPRMTRVNALFPQRNLEALQQPEVVKQAGDAVRDRVVALTGRTPDQFEVVVDDGTPAEALVRNAEEMGAELVVVGALADSLLGRLLGGVAERVIRHAHVSVLVARKTAETGHVLAATDFSEVGLAAVRAAAAEARWRGARLHVVHCMNLVLPDVVSDSAHPFAPGTGGHLAPETLAEMRRDADTQLADALRRCSADGERHVLDGEAGNAIVTLADELRPELTVVGTVGRSGLRRLLLGSVAEYVVRQSQRATLVVRDQQAPRA